MHTSTHIGTVGMLLQRARMAASLSLQQLARRVSFSAGYLCDVEKGRRNVTPALCERLPGALGLDRVELYARAGLLPETLHAYLARVPRALGLLELLAELDARETLIEELSVEARRKAALRRGFPYDEDEIEPSEPVP